MAIVDHDHCIKTVGKRAYAANIGEIAVHGKYPIGHDNDPPGILRTRGFQLFLEIGHVAIGEPVALGFRQSYAVDDRGMVEAVRYDGILLPEQRLEHAAIGIETGGIENGILHAEISGNRMFELAVQVRGSADEAHGGHAEAMAVERRLCCRDQLRAVGEAEVIIGT